MTPFLLRTFAGSLVLILAACNATGVPTATRSDRLPPGCNSPTALALAIRNESKDSPNDRRRLPC